MAGNRGRFEADIATPDDENTAARTHFAGELIGITLVAGEIDALESAAHGGW